MVFMLHRLTRTADYQHIGKVGRRFDTPYFIIRAIHPKEKPSPLMPPLDLIFGITASRHVGNAVIRNRAKRRIRALMQHMSQKYSLRQTGHVVIIAKKACADAPYPAMIEQLHKALTHLGFLK